MKTPTLFAIATLAAACCCASSPAWAQKVYRCGSVYSQTPCEGAVSLDVNDSRTPAQQRESEQVARRDGKSADTLEKRRLQEEKQIAAQDAAARKEAGQRQLAEKQASAAQEKSVAHPVKRSKKGKKEPAFFTASVEKAPVDKKSAKPAKSATP